MVGESMTIRRRDPKIIGCMAWRPSALQYKHWSVDGQNLELRYTLFIQNWLACGWDRFHDWLMWRFHWWFLGLSAVLLQKDAVSNF
ncbi:unnamed protein product [Allacma fusca]|uniref:Uncharacterized protein n=1 Tax=Allacma fusca TaxID=39272 RepID=A0A8J2P6C5_9HEXA|nr:unnamed protein product [Allacma fusca]